jgi:ribonuclease HI
VGVAFFVQQKLTVQPQFRLGTRCSNNQAEKLEIVKALETIDTINIPENCPHTIHIFTYCRITLDLLENATNRSYLIEEIRKRLFHLYRANWTIGISWLKAHAGIHGNEMADQLAKAATRISDILVSFNLYLTGAPPRVRYLNVHGTKAPTVMRCCHLNYNTLV